MKTVIVTGANGFVGFYLLKQLKEMAYRVIATGRGASRYPLSHPAVIYEALDLKDREAVARLFSVYQPGVVIHAGAVSKPDDCEQDKPEAYAINVEGTANLLEGAAVCNSHFVFLSTDFIFDGERGMYTERDQPGPVNYYGQTKLLGEGKVKAYPHAWSIVRTVLVYGDPQGGRDNIVSSVAKAVQKGETLHIFDDQVRTPTYVEDLATCIITIMEGTKKGIYHVSGKDVLTPYGIACAVADYLQLDKKGINKVTRETFPQLALRPLKTGFDIAKARKELGFEPLSFEEGLKKTFAK